jgi:phosphoribosyl-ATP pyrophosphohydrolase
MMSDSLERLHRAVVAARNLDPATSRTARLFQRGPSKMAKKVAEEAIEVVIDALAGKRDDVVRESADLLYNLTVLWVAAGISPQDVWAEMDRRERNQGIAEKLPKTSPKSSAREAQLAEAAAPASRRRVASRHSGVTRRLGGKSR